MKEQNSKEKTAATASTSYLKSYPYLFVRETDQVRNRKNFYFRTWFFKPLK